VKKEVIHDKHWPDLHIHFEALLNTSFPIHVFCPRLALAMHLQFQLCSKAGLADHDNYHEFCRLLGRFRVNYQVDLCAVFSSFCGLSTGLYF